MKGPVAVVDRAAIAAVVGVELNDTGRVLTDGDTHEIGVGHAFASA